MESDSAQCKSILDFSKIYSKINLWTLDSLKIEMSAQFKPERKREKIPKNDKIS